MNFFLTIDVETYTGDYDLDVHGHGKGLDYILEQLKEHDVKATFFVEALGATRWGTEGLKKVCRSIRDAGHEIQLHVHPVVADIDGFSDSGDKLYDHDAATQEMLIRKGLEILAECGISKISAFRAGDLAANVDTLSAMKECSLKLGSNRDLDQKGSIQSRLNGTFSNRNDISSNDGVIDLPVSCFRSPVSLLDGQYRHLQVCAAGSGEIRGVIHRMIQGGYSCCTILTHPGEFFHKTEQGAPENQKNRSRFEDLLCFVKSNNEIRVQTISCATGIEIPEKSPSDVSPRLKDSLKRIGEQLVGRFGL